MATSFWFLFSLGKVLYFSHIQVYCRKDRFFHFEDTEGITLLLLSRYLSCYWTKNLNALSHLCLRKRKKYKISMVTWQAVCSGLHFSPLCLLQTLDSGPFYSPLCYQNKGWGQYSVCSWNSFRLLFLAL